MPSNVKDLPSSEDEFWIDSNKQTVDTSKLPVPEVHNSNVKRRGGYAVFAIDGAEVAVGIDWDKFDIRGGSLIKR